MLAIYLHGLMEMAVKSADAIIQSISGEPRPFTELTPSAEFARVRDYRSIERDAPSLAPIPSEPARDPEEQRDAKKAKSTRCRYYQNGSFVEHLVFFCALSVASYAGVLSRIYLADLQAWNGVALFPSFSAELVGTAIMGFITSHKKLLQNSHKALYQAIATGLCGSITTFSSWNFEAIEVLLQVGRAPPNNAERIVGWFTVLVIGVGMPIAALLFGQHVAHLSPWSDCKLGDDEVLDRPRQRYRIPEQVVIVLVWVCCSCLVIYVPLHFKQYDILFSCVFCFAGTYVRWHLAPLNALITNFKLGTFIVNIMGAWVLGGVAVVKTHYESELEQVTMAVLTGIGTGFCGCLTTVSTFAVELSTLPLTRSYNYGFLSLALAQLGLLAIRGTYMWTQ